MTGKHLKFAYLSATITKQPLSNFESWEFENTSNLEGWSLTPVAYKKSVYILNACKLDLKENLFHFFVESIAFRIKIVV